MRSDCSVSMLQLPWRIWRWNLFGKMKNSLLGQKHRSAELSRGRHQPSSALGQVLPWALLSQSHTCFFHFVGFSSIATIQICCSRLPLFRGTMAWSQLLAASIWSVFQEILCSKPAPASTLPSYSSSHYPSDNKYFLSCYTPVAEPWESLGSAPALESRLSMRKGEVGRENRHVEPLLLKSFSPHSGSAAKDVSTPASGSCAACESRDGLHTP